MKDIFFVGNARCYHTMDWYRTTRRICAQRVVALVTDLVDSEGHTVLIGPDDDVRQLIVIDGFLLRRQSRLGNLWRNAVKFAFIPLQALQLRKFARAHNNAVFHAHTMYYMFLCSIAGIAFIGTPQGSEVLVRPHRSRMYRWFARRALAAAAVVTVDSAAMQKGVLMIAKRKAELVQNGIDLAAVMQPTGHQQPRSGILSLRGFTDLYRIRQIVQAHTRDPSLPPLSFIYPFWDEQYRASVLSAGRPDNCDLGRVQKEDMVRLLWQTMLVVSVPISDSSPRSVYEAIFAGAPVVTVQAAWVDALPECMRKRLIIVDILENGWLNKAMATAPSIANTPYRPSEQAIQMFSQDASIGRVIEQFYSV